MWGQERLLCDAHSAVRGPLGVRWGSGCDQAFSRSDMALQCAGAANRAATSCKHQVLTAETMNHDSSSSLVRIQERDFEVMSDVLKATEI